MVAPVRGEDPEARAVFEQAGHLLSGASMDLGFGLVIGTAGAVVLYALIACASPP